MLFLLPACEESAVFTSVTAVRSCSSQHKGRNFATEPQLQGMPLEVVLWLQNPLHLHISMIPLPYFKYVSWFMWIFPKTVFIFCLSATLPNHLGPSISTEYLHKCCGELLSLSLHLSVHKVGSIASISFAVRHINTKISINERLK